MSFKDCLCYQQRKLRKDQSCDLAYANLPTYCAVPQWGWQEPEWAQPCANTEMTAYLDQGTGNPSA